MIGAIIGDVIGSRFEVNNVKHKEFALFHRKSRFTDDTVLSIAVADCILNSRSYQKAIKEYGQFYPAAGYGGRFKDWLSGKIDGPYNSWGNGSAMRVSPIGFAYDSTDMILAEAKKSADITHNHPEGVKGAQAMAMAVYWARRGLSKADIKTSVEEMFDYDLSRTIADIRPIYKFDVSCQGSVPEAMIAFLESTDFEDAIRTAISIGGDSDTIASMTGALAEAFYKVIPDKLVYETQLRLPRSFCKMIYLFEEQYGVLKKS